MNDIAKQSGRSTRGGSGLVYVRCGDQGQDLGWRFKLPRFANQATVSYDTTLSDCTGMVAVDGVPRRGAKTSESCSLLVPGLYVQGRRNADAGLGTETLLLHPSHLSLFQCPISASTSDHRRISLSWFFRGRVHVHRFPSLRQI